MEKNARQLYNDGCLEIRWGDKAKGRALLKQSADAGCKMAMYEYAKTCEDKKQEFELYKIAADNGCGIAAYILGGWYAFGINTDQNTLIAGKYILKAYSCGVRPNSKYYGDDRDCCIMASDLEGIIDYIVDQHVYLEDPYDVLPIAMDAHRFGVISERELQEVEEWAERLAGHKRRDRIARTCPKCGAYYAKVEKRKQPIGKRAAVGGAIGLLGGPVGILIGAGVGALTSKEKEYCVCPGCGHVWEYKLPQ